MKCLIVVANTSDNEEQLAQLNKAFESKKQNKPFDMSIKFTLRRRMCSDLDLTTLWHNVTIEKIEYNGVIEYYVFLSFLDMKHIMQQLKKAKENDIKEERHVMQLLSNTVATKLIYKYNGTTIKLDDECVILADEKHHRTYVL